MSSIGTNTRHAGAPATQGAIRQPLLGALGLVWVAIFFVVLGVLPGAAESLEAIGPVTTFMLPALVVVALWWRGWPFRDLGQPASGILGTLLIVAAGIGLGLLGQSVVGRADFDGLFSTSAGVEQGRFVAFPFTVPLAGLVFASMLQLTFVNGREPLSRLGEVGSGLAALVVAWVGGVALFLLLADWDPVVPPPAQEQLGLSNPGGPVDAMNLLGWTLSVAAWQVVLFILLRGKPFERIRSAAARVATANLAPVALGWLTYLLLNDGFDWTIPRISAVTACVIAASLAATLLMGGWPASRAARPAAGAATIVATAAALTAIAYFGLKGLGNAVEDWTPELPVELWVAVAALNYVAAVIILHADVWNRWPLSGADEERS